jgi:hypothetical protein
VIDIRLFLISSHGVPVKAGSIGLAGDMGFFAGITMATRAT